MNVTIIQALFNWFADCEILSPDYDLNVDSLGEDAQQYCIEVVPCKSVITRYTDGSSKNQYLFIFASREFYSEDECNNMKNLGFYEKLGYKTVGNVIDGDTFRCIRMEKNLNAGP